MSSLKSMPDDASLETALEPFDDVKALQAADDESKKDDAALKAEVIAALKKHVAKVAGVDQAKAKQSAVPAAAKKKSSPKSAETAKKSCNKNKSPKTAESAKDVGTPKKKRPARRGGKKKKGNAQTTSDSSPQAPVSNPTQQNNTTPSSDEKSNKKTKGRKEASKQKSGNLAVYLEELLYELSCLELAQSEHVLPFNADHIRLLANREVARVRAQLSPNEVNVKPISLVPSPGVRRLTVFPEEFAANYDMNNLVGLNGDMDRVSWRRLPNKNRFPSLVSPLDNGLEASVHDGLVFSMSHKMYIPEHPSYNFIGRILGPRGNSVRRLEALTDCKILIRGKGSVKDPNREAKLRNVPGWEHLKDALHVSITAEDMNEHICNMKLRRAAVCVQRLLTPIFDDYKRQQLVQLAIINGTYRP